MIRPGLPIGLVQHLNRIQINETLQFFIRHPRIQIVDRDRVKEVELVCAKQSLADRNSLFGFVITIAGMIDIRVGFANTYRYRKFLTAKLFNQCRQHIYKGLFLGLLLHAHQKEDDVIAEPYIVAIFTAFFQRQADGLQLVR